MPISTEDVVRLGAACQILGISRPTLRGMIRSGLLPRPVYLSLTNQFWLRKDFMEALRKLSNESQTKVGGE